MLAPDAIPTLPGIALGVVLTVIALWPHLGRGGDDER